VTTDPQDSPADNCTTCGTANAGSPGGPRRSPHAGLTADSTQGVNGESEKGRLRAETSRSAHSAAHWTSSYVELGRAEGVVSAADSSAPRGGAGSCSSCGASIPESSQMPRVGVERVFRTRENRWWGSFGERMYLTYDLFAYLVVPTQPQAARTLVLIDPTTGIGDSFGSVDLGATWFPFAGSGTPRLWSSVAAYDASGVTFRLANGTRLRFSFTGRTAGTITYARLDYIADRNDNRITFSYQFPATGAPESSTLDVNRRTQAVDAYGYRLLFRYATFRGNPVVDRITLPDGRNLDFSYDPSVNDSFFSRLDYGGGIRTTWSFRLDSMVGSAVRNEALLPADERMASYVLQKTGDPAPGAVIAVRWADGADRYSRTDVRNSFGDYVATVNSLGEITQATATSQSVIRTHQRLGEAAATQYASGTEDTGSYAQPGSVSQPDGRYFSVERHPTNGRVTRRDYPGDPGNPGDPGTSESFTYNAFGQITSHTDRNGRVTVWQYDAAGNMLSHTVAAGTAVQATESWTYNARGQVLTHTGFRGQTCVYTYYEAEAGGGAGGGGGGGESGAGDRADAGEDGGGGGAGGAGAGGGAPGELRTITVPASPGRPAGTTTFRYDAMGRLAQTQDPVGRLVDYAYDDAGRLVSVAYGDGSTETMTYGTGDLSSELLETKDRNGNRTVRSYNANGQVVSVSVVEAVTGNVLTRTDMTYQAGSGLLLTSVTDGDSVEYTYDYRSRPLTVTRHPSAGASLVASSAYDQYHLVRSTDPYGRETRYVSFDQDDRVTQVDTALLPGGGGPVITTTRAFDAVGNLTLSADGRQIVTLYAYDERNRLVTETLASGTPDQAVRSYAYDDDSNRTSVTDERGKVWTATHTSDNRVRTSLNPYGQGTTYSYYADGLVETMTNANGHATAYVYDTCCGGAVARLTEVIDALGNRDRFEYDFNGNRTKSTDREGRIVTTAYDGLNRVVRTVRDPGPGRLNLTSTVAYDPTPGVIGRRVTTTSPASQAVVTQYDGVGRVSSVTGDTPATAYAYDAVDGPTGFLRVSATDANGNATATLSDGAGRTRRTIDGRGKVTAAEYDDNSNPVRLTDADGIVTTRVYDYRDRPQILAENDNVGQPGWTAPVRLTYLFYDPSGNLTDIWDAEARITRYAYDDAGRRTSETYAYSDPEQKTRTVSYTPLGQPAVVTKFSGRTIAFAYDDLERPHTRTYSTGGADAFEWHRNGLLKSAVRGSAFYESMGYLWGDVAVESSDIGADYDMANRNLRQGQRGGDVHRTWTADDLLASVSYPSGVAGSQAQYAYTNRRELDRVAVDGAEVARHTYDAGGRRATRTRANGVTTAWGFDAADRLVSLSHGAVQAWQFGRSDAGDLTWKRDTTDATRSDAYSHDPLHRLTGDRKGVMDMANGVPSPTFTQGWDLSPVGNWTTFTDNGTAKAGTFGAHHQQTARSDIAVPIAYDGDLNVTDDGRFRYVYDINDRLTEVRNRLTGELIAFYAYDALGRRVIVSDPSNGNGLWYCSYDGQRIVEMYDGGNDWGITFTYGSYVDEPVTLTTNADFLGLRTFWYHQDQVFSTAALTDSTGAAAERYDYTAYGVTTVYDGSWANPGSNSRLRNRFAFTGRELDPESQTYHYRARTYLPLLGRFAQRDPAGYADGMGLYEYVRSSPSNRLDPDGRLTVDAYGYVGAYGGVKALDAFGTRYLSNPVNIMAQYDSSGRMTDSPGSILARHVEAVAKKNRQCIDTLHIYGHGSGCGTQCDANILGPTFDANTPPDILKRIAVTLCKGAKVTIHSCSSGANPLLVQKLANLLQADVKACPGNVVYQARAYGAFGFDADECEGGWLTVAPDTLDRGIMNQRDAMMAAFESWNPPFVLDPSYTGW
jgi:RHS repeat-associated protein